MRFMRILMAFVALRKESVDRNLLGRFFVFVWFVVALRKESVDRNRLFLGVARCKRRSLSARRAWIEINKTWDKTISRASLSARRAWIEIQSLCSVRHIRCVALRKESVDRNRTPHQRNTRPIPSLSARRAWIEIPLSTI